VMLGCRLRFEVDHVRMTVRWESHASSRFRWSGAVAFEPSGGRACVLRFRIDTSFARDVGLAVPPPDGRSFMECFKLFARGVLPMFAEGSAPHVRPLPPAETAAAVPRRPPPPPPEAMRARPAPTPGPAASPMAASARLAAGALRLPLPAPAVPGAGAMELSDGANKWLT